MMPRRPLRFLRLVSAIASVLCLAALSAAPAQALTNNQRFGVGDQNNPEMFADPRYQALKPTITRFIAHWDVVARGGHQLEQLDLWYAGAIAAGQEPLVALGAFKETRAPSTATWTRALRALRARYPRLREIAVFNEANHATQPITYRRPDRAARYYLATKKVFNRPGDRIVAATVVLGSNAIRWSRSFQKALPRRERDRLIWGVHNYGSVNAGNDANMRAFLRTIRSRDIWLTESSAWAQFAIPKWAFDLVRQQRATTRVFDYALKYRKRVSRLYWYEWQGTAPADPEVRWDSGLIGPDGVARPAYQAALAARFRTR